jgi:hypothetical protein
VAQGANFASKKKKIYDKLEVDFRKKETQAEQSSDFAESWA